MWRTHEPTDNPAPGQRAGHPSGDRPPFYLSQGVKDVIVFHPLTLLVLHVRKDRTTRQVSPVLIPLEAGCQVLV